MSPRRAATAALLGVAVVLVAATAWLRTPLGDPLEVAVYRDDAYYYFDWVRHVAAGDGPRVGVGPETSGVHFGWALALLGLRAIGGDAGLEAGARWLGLGLLWIAGVILARASVREGAPRWVAAGLGLALVGHPDLWLEAQNGQETALALAALAWVFHERRAGAARFAVACLLLAFARSDLWPMAAACALVRDGRIAARAVGPGLALAAVLVANVAIAGHPLPDAAQPMAWLFGQRLDAEIAAGRDRIEALWWWGRPVLFGIPFLRAAAVGTAVLLALAVARWLPRRLAAVGLLVMALGAGLGVDHLGVPILAAVLVAVPGRAGWRPPCRVELLAAGLLAGGLGLAFVHYLLRLYPRPYYFVPLAVVGCFGLGLAAALRHPLAALALAATLAHHASLLAGTPPRRPLQRTMAIAGQELDRFVPADATVGAFNSGILTWHRYPGPVLNLDGVVNRDAFDALRAARLGAYLDARGVGWLCDNPVQFALEPRLPHASGRWFGAGFDPGRDLVEVARFVVAGESGDRPGTDAFALFRRRGSTASREPLAPHPPVVEPARDGHGVVVRWVGAVGERLRIRPVALAGPEADLPAVLGVAWVVAVPDVAPRSAAVDVRVVPPPPR